MDTRREARAAVADAERRIRDLAKRELDAGRYDDADWLLDLARRLGSLVGEIAGPEPAAAGPGPAPTAARRPAKAPPARHARRRAGAYPTYRRQGDSLVKVGWSKKSKQEYEHRAPREAIDGVLHALKARRRGAFSIEDLGEIEGEGGRPAPSYQVYLVIGWLRSIDAVIRRGRSNYELAGDNLDRAAIEAAWERMASGDDA
jgi:hypothetical protein